jgi:pimeloyl-ACP methyl ester carboxylesterase
MTIAMSAAAQTRIGPPMLTTPGADEWYLRTPDTVSLYIREFGQGEPVIVLHGGWGWITATCSPRSMVSRASRTSSSTISAARFALPPLPPRSPCKKHVEDLDLLRQRLGLNRVTILAHSMGTFLAQSYLEAHPDRVKGLILTGAIAPLNDSLHSALGALSKVGGELSTRPEVDSELKKAGLLNKTDMTDQEKTRTWRIRLAGINLYHVDRWREVEGGQVFFNQTAANAASRTMPARWNFIPPLRAHSCRALRRDRSAGLRGLRRRAVARRGEANSKSQTARLTGSGACVVDRSAGLVSTNCSRGDSGIGELQIVSLELR